MNPFRDAFTTTSTAEFLPPLFPLCLPWLSLHILSHFFCVSPPLSVSLLHFLLVSYSSALFNLPFPISTFFRSPFHLYPLPLDFRIIPSFSTFLSYLCSLSYFNFASSSPSSVSFSFLLTHHSFPIFLPSSPSSLSLSSTRHSVSTQLCIFLVTRQVRRSVRFYVDLQHLSSVRCISILLLTFSLASHADTTRQQVVSIQ